MVNQKWTNIVKADNDDREISVMKFTNELKAVVVSDPKADKAAVAVTVQVGSACDPDTLQGLAHFLEHMLFLGSEKFTEENDYKKFLTEHGGSSNADTHIDKTMFYFTVSPEHLFGAMDRLSQFFIKPLFSPSATERELRSVALEYERNKKIDRRRLMRLERWLSKVGHPYRKFSTGNKKLLDIEPRSKGINVRNELINFYNNWYSANLITMAVVSNERLSDLEDKVGVFFSNIENKYIEPYSFSEPPYQEEEKGVIYFTSPVKNRRSLTLMFPCPDYTDHYKSGPAKYLKHILEYCGKGSLYSYLKKNLWIEGKVEAGLQVMMKGYGKFYIRIKLTDEGISMYEEVIHLVFQYINMIKETGPQEWIFDECVKIEEIKFQYGEKPSTQAIAINLSNQLIRIPYEDILVSDYRMTNWNPSIIINLLGFLKPKNSRIRVVGRRFDIFLKEEEPIYGVKYKIENIKPSLLNQWNEYGTRKDFFISPPNTMIPTHFSLISDKIVSDYPIVIYENKLTRVWMMHDNYYLLPKVYMKLNFHCPLTHRTPVAKTLIFLMMSIWEESLIEEYWDAHVAGMSSTVEHTSFGFRILISGFSQKISRHTLHVLGTMINMQYTNVNIASRKEALRNFLTNKELDTPPAQSEYLLKLIMKDDSWSNEDLLSCIDGITTSLLETFGNFIWIYFFCETLIYGNMTRKEGELLWNQCRDLLPNQPFPVSMNQVRESRYIVLPVTKNMLFQKDEEVHTSSCVTVYFQIGIITHHIAALTDLFYQYIKEPIFSVLRTREQLAYHVYRNVDKSNNSIGLCIRLLTDRHPKYVDEKIESLLRILGNNLEHITEEDFETHKQALIQNKLTVCKNMLQKSEEIWEEIGNGQYCFDRKKQEVEEIRTITKNNLIDFYKNYIDPQAPTRRKLSIILLSVTEENRLTLLEDYHSIDYEQIENITKFKNSCYAYPTSCSLHLGNESIPSQTID